MKTLFSIFLILIFTSLFTKANAQVKQESFHFKSSADSLQMQRMKDSLNIQEDIISHVLELRDSLFIIIKQIRTDQTLINEEKEKQVALIRTHTNERIKEIMGKDAFLKYLEMIKYQLRKRERDTLPLAGVSEN